MMSFSKKTYQTLFIVGLSLFSQQNFAINTQLPPTEFSLPKTNQYHQFGKENDKVWTNRLPELHQGEGLIDNQQDTQIGEWALRQINATAPLIDDAWLQQSMEQLLWQMNAVVRQQAPLALTIINDREINAFAVPSGLIGINVGLFDKSRNMDEMASVLAHEIAHVSQRHFHHRNDEKGKQMLTQIIGMLAGIAVATADSDAGVVALLGTQAISANQTASFSRSQEQEADRVGMQIMAQAGYDVHAMPSFFALMNQQNPIKANAFIPSFILSHPLTAERLSEANARASTYPKLANQYAPIRQHRQQLFEQMQWRSRYLAKMVNKNELLQASKSNDGAKLALILQLMDEKNYSQAKQHLQHFQSQINDFTNPLAVIISAQLAQRQGNHAQAIQQLTNLANLFPERRDSRLYLADTYLAITANQPQNAQQVITMLQPLVKQYPRDIGIWQRLQQASEILAKNGDNQQKTLQQINVLKYRANVEFWQNRLKEAMTSLDQAKQLAEKLPKNGAIISQIQQQMDAVNLAHQFKTS